MASEPFHSLGGFTTGIPVIEVVDANGNVVTNVNTSGNVSANVIYATEYKFANGDPLTSSAAGSNTQVQYNNDDAFGADSTFTFDQITKTLAVSNFIASGNLVNLGDVENLHISGGINGYVLQTDGAGNLSWTAQTGNGGGNGSPGGSNMQVQFNDAGDFGGDAGFFYDKDTNLLTVTYISGDGNKLSNIAGANVSGEVNYAAIANSVTVSNVSGIGTIAVVNLDSNVSNVLRGDGSWGAAATDYNNSNVVSLLASFGSNTITTTGLITGNGYGLSNIPYANITGTPTLGNISSININGNSEQVLYGNGVFAAITGGGGNGVPGGSNTQLQFNDDGDFGGISALTFDKTTGNFTVTSNTDFSLSPSVDLSVANLHIDGGVNGYFLQTDGTGNLSWSAGGGGGNGVPGGSNTQVQFNDAGDFGGSANFTFNKTTKVLTVNGNISAGNISGTLTTASQPNITAVGTLTSLFVSGSITSFGTIAAPTVQGTVSVQAGDLSATDEVDFSAATSVNLGNVDIVSIGGGSDGYVLQTDGAGNLSWGIAGGTPGGANTQIQFNDDGAFNGTSALTFDKTSNTVQVNGNFTANTYTIGSSSYTFQTQRVYFASTFSGATGQLIYEIPTNSVYGAEFVIISTDSSAGLRQLTKLNSIVFGNTVTYNETSTLAVDELLGEVGPFADFTIDVTGSNLCLRVTPNSANTMQHRLLITSYL